MNTEGALAKLEPVPLCLITENQDLEKPASMSSRLKGAGGIGSEDGGEEEGTRANRPYPPGLQPGGESFRCLPFCFYFINYA